MGQLRRLRNYVFQELEDVGLEGMTVRYGFLEDEGDPVVSPSTGIEAWSEPSLVIRFIISQGGQDVSRLDVRFARGEWLDVQTTPDEVLASRLESARHALNSHTESLRL